MPSCATTSDDLCTSLTIQLFPVAGISVCSSETSNEGSRLQANSTNTMQISFICFIPKDTEIWVGNKFENCVLQNLNRLCKES
jgi:hypothetical protein